MVNTLLANVGDAPEKVILKLFASQCCHFYGSQAWNYSDKTYKNSTLCGTGVSGGSWMYHSEPMFDIFPIWPTWHTPSHRFMQGLQRLQIPC